MHFEELFSLVFVLCIFAGVFIIFLAMRQRSRQLEMQHLERMAMIERGQAPLADPLPSLRPDAAVRPAFVAASLRSLSAGIIVVGLGMALALVIGLAGGSPEIGLGLGGAIATIGGAFIVKSLVVKNHASAHHVSARQEDLP
jgi:hypothetical protein